MQMHKKIIGVLAIMKELLLELQDPAGHFRVIVTPDFSFACFLKVRF